MLERKCVKSYRSLQHRNGVKQFKQVENQSRNHALRKRTCLSMHAENGNSLFCLQTTASHFFIHWFDVTNVCKQPNDVIFNGDTSLFDSFHCSNVT